MQMNMTIRNPMPEPSGSSAIPCATPTLNGFKKAAAYPAAQPHNTMPAPVMESKPIAIKIGTKIGTNAMVSSHIPNVAPQTEKRTQNTGTNAMELPRIFWINLPTPASIACVDVKTFIDPPNINRKKIICAASCIPRGTEVRNCISVTGVGSTV